MTLSRTTRQVLGVVVTALALALFWWTQGSDDGGPANDSGAATPSPTSSVSYSGDASPTDVPAEPTATAPTEPTDTGPHTGDVDPESGLRWVELGDLPAEAKETVALIDSGGPFPYSDHDGMVFENREEILPDEDYGYYREYTVPTPGSEDRGARRIVTGAGGEFYWTQDHYSSFERIAL